jgi:hypothetical protein
MPDVAVMAPDLETGNNISKIYVLNEQMWWYPDITYYYKHITPAINIHVTTVLYICVMVLYDGCNIDTALY